MEAVILHEVSSIDDLFDKGNDLLITSTQDWNHSSIALFEKFKYFIFFGLQSLNRNLNPYYLI
ncbi:hypothetical protein SDJN02_27800, partial [Cucurbita argyrosperma subsp. argyrosperma]